MYKVLDYVLDYTEKKTIIYFSEDITMVKLPMKPAEDLNDACSISACNGLFVDVNVHGQHVTLGRDNYSKQRPDYSRPKKSSAS